MNNEILVSIIVPNYNNEKYIRDCINSLIKQTYKNIEIIIIDDGSTDNSKNIIKEYLVDERIKLICQKNQGANIARQEGIKVAQGSYCLFVDGDDWIDNKTIEELVKIINKKKYQVVKFLGIIEPSGVIKNKYDFHNKKQVELTYPNIYELLIQTRILHNLCFSIYKKELLIDNKAMKSNISYAEDYYANLEIFSKKPSTIIINQKFYHYRTNNNSTTKIINQEKIIKNFNEMIFVYEKLFEYIKLWDINNEYNKSIVALTILDATRELIITILRIKNINRKIYNRLIKELLNKQIFNYIQNNIEYKKIKKIIRKKSIKYKLRNTIYIKSIYYKKINILYFSKYLISIYDFKKIIGG